MINKQDKEGKRREQIQRDRERNNRGYNKVTVSFLPGS
jgi:hypothetical protein